MRKPYTTFRALLVFTTFIISALARAGDDSGSQVAVREIASPAASGSAEPNLNRGADGLIYLSWIEPASENRHALRFAVFSKGGWGEPRTIATGDNWFVNWADFPSLVSLGGGRLAAHWLAKSAAGAYAYDVNVSRSTDGGKTWSKPLVPHRDGTQTEHGFVSMLPLAGGRVGAAWLDGRSMKGGSHDSHATAGGAMTLRYATIEADGRLTQESLLDARVCECCQTGAALTSEGAVVVYRDRSEQEVRDISFVRLYNGRWTEPKVLHADGWRIEGCPVNGPAIAAHEKQAAVAWFTAAGDSPRVNVSFSSDAGATFSRPVQVDDGSPVGRVDIEVLADGSALVLWLERTSRGAEIKLRRVRRDGTRDQSLTVAESKVARASGFPRMAREGDEIVFAWTGPAGVRTALAKIKL